MKKRWYPLITLGHVGFGEAGYNMSRDPDRTKVRVIAYDMMSAQDSVRGEAIRSNAKSVDVELMDSMETLVQQADIIFCLTGQRSALPIARQIAPMLREGQIYSDLNSLSPASKEEIGQVFESSKGDFVESAVMASVPANRTHVPIYVCGKCAQKVADALNPAGYNIRYISEKLGAASATKMLKSVLFKGMIALLTETVFATDRYGITDDVIHALKSIMTEEMTFEGCCDYFVGTMATHCVRLGTEMEQVLETLDSMGEDSTMTKATLAKMRWIEQQGYAEHFPLRPSGIEEVLTFKRELQKEK